MMRTILKISTISALLLTALNALAADWPQWRGPGRDGVVSDARLPQTWPSTLTEQWKVPVGIGHSSPIVAGDRIYVFTRQGDDEVLLTLDATTGKEMWRSAQPIAYEMHPAARGHGKGPKSTPVIANGTVCTLGISGVLSCHDARTGKTKWRREFAKLFSSASPLYGTAMSPVIDNGLLIAHVGGHDKGALTAFELETGTVKWSNDSDGPAYASPIVITSAGVRQVVTFMQKSLVGVEATSGKLLWSIPAKSEYDTNSVTPVAFKDLIIFAREGQGLSAIRLNKSGSQLTPQEVWNNKDVELYLNSPVLQGSVLIGLSVKQKGQFFAIDGETGKTVWLSGGRMGENAAILNLNNKAILILTTDANLIVQPAGLKNYSAVARYTVANSPTWAHPVVIGNRIIVKDENTLASWVAAEK